MAEVRVVGAAKLKEGKSRIFDFETPYLSQGSQKVHQRQGFVLCHQGKLLAFENSCPHWSVELDLGDGHFYDPALDRIYCKNHGALFVLPSGQCETGPCLGRSLTAFALVVDGADVVVSV